MSGAKLNMLVNALYLDGLIFTVITHTPVSAPRLMLSISPPVNKSLAFAARLGMPASA